MFAGDPNVLGYRTSDCVCEAYTMPPCSAGFIVTPGVIDTAGTDPIMLWIFNTSFGGTEVYTYLWDFGDSQTSTAASPTHTYAQPGTYTLTLTATSPITCNGQDVATATVTIEPAGPQLQAMNDTLVCGPLASFTLVANSFGTADTWHWSSNAQFTDLLNASFSDSTATLSPAQSGTYHVRASNGSACVSEDSVVVTISLGAISVAGDQGICALDTARLILSGADPGSVITWSPAEDIISGLGTGTALVAPTEQTTYGVSVTAPSGCAWSSTVTVSVSPLFGNTVTATATPDLVLPGTTVQLQATPGNGVTYRP